MRTISVYVILIFYVIVAGVIAQPIQQTNVDQNRLKIGYVYKAQPGFNPLLEKYEHDLEINKLIFGDGMFVTGTNGELVNGVALTVREEDEKIWTITLQPEVYFHDGKALDANDVKFSYDLYNKFALQAPHLFMAQYIQSVRVINTYTIQFILKQPVEDFPTVLGQLPILHQNRYADWYLQSNVMRLPPVTPVGVGPFVFKVMNNGQITLDRHREYFKMRPQLDGIDILFFDTYEELINAFVQNNIDVIDVDDRNIYRKINQLTNAANFSWIKRNNLKLYYILLNTRRRPFNETNVRKALNQAINKNDLVEMNLPNKSYIAGSLLDPNSEYYFASSGQYKYDPLNSIAILKNLGFVRQRNGKLFRNGRELKFEINYEKGSSLQEAIVRIVSISLGELGINVQPRPLKASEIENRIVEGNYEAVLRHFQYDPAKSLQIPRQFYMQELNSLSGFQNIKERRLEVVIRRSEQTLQMNALIPIIQRIQFLYYDYAPCVFLFFEDQVYVAIQNKFLNTKKIYRDNLNIQTKLTPKYEWYIKNTDTDN